MSRAAALKAWVTRRAGGGSKKSPSILGARGFLGGLARRPSRSPSMRAAVIGQNIKVAQKVLGKAKFVPGAYALDSVGRVSPRKS